jgi:hypothetical protein
MKLPISVTRPLFILIAAMIGGFGFALIGLMIGFYSFFHWVAGVALVIFTIYVLPMIFTPPNR